MTEYADPDLEAIALLPPVDETPPAASEPDRHGGERKRWVAILAGLVVVALVTGFAAATVILNATDHEGVLDGLVVRQSDVPAAFTVQRPPDGVGLATPTLDLCNGTFPSEALRTGRRQVYVGPANATSTSFSTEAVLYRKQADGAQALAELQSVVAHCPPTPVVSPVGEPTVITRFTAAPDTTWPKNPAVQRQAYAFVTTDPQSGGSVPSIAVYLRRGRALMGLYFAQPTGAQIPIEGQSSVQGIVGVFEARMAHLSSHVVGG